MRLFDIADPANPVRRFPSDFGLNYANDSWVQNNYGFIHNRKLDMARFLAGDANPIVLTLNEVNTSRPPGAQALPNRALTGVNTSPISLPLGNHRCGQ